MKKKHSIQAVLVHTFVVGAKSERQQENKAQIISTHAGQGFNYSSNASAAAPCLL